MRRVLLENVCCTNEFEGNTSQSECRRSYSRFASSIEDRESCGFPEVASAVLLQAVDMESVVVNTEYLSVGNHG